MQLNNYKIVDTNIFLSFPQIINKEDDIVIATDVLRELDGLKMNPNQEIAFQARRAAVLISKAYDKFIFNDDLEESNMKVDDKLLELTRKLNGVLITNDVYLKVKAKIKGIETKGYGGIEEYTGVYYWNVDVDENLYNKGVELVLTTRRPLDFMDLKENQYLIIKSTNGDDLGIYQHRNGFLREIERKPIKNKWIDKITPKNLEQECLFDLLRQEDITVIYASGCQGVGKSFILNNFALQQLEKGTIKKIVYVPNNAYVEHSLEVGILPGDSFNKMTPMIGPLIDLIGIDAVTRMLEEETLEIVPLAFMRGRNFDDSIVIVNEAQNLNANHIKLLIGRIGHNSRIFMDGSLTQIDSELFKNTNGLKQLLKLSNTPYSNYFGTVKMNKVERSKTAQIADYLDQIGGF